MVDDGVWTACAVPRRAAPRCAVLFRARLSLPHNLPSSETIQTLWGFLFDRNDPAMR